MSSVFFCIIQQRFKVSFIYIFHFSFYKFIYLFIFIFGCVGLHCCAWAFSCCSEQGLLFVAEHGL